MTKLRNMRVIEIPRFRAVSSGEKTLDEIFGEDGFDAWCGAHPERFVPHFTSRTICSGMWASRKRTAMGIAQQQIFLPLRLIHDTKTANRDA